MLAYLSLDIMVPATARLPAQLPKTIPHTCLPAQSPSLSDTRKDSQSDSRCMDCRSSSVTPAPVLMRDYRYKLTTERERKKRKLTTANDHIPVLSSQLV